MHPHYKCGRTTHTNASSSRKSTSIHELEPFHVRHAPTLQDMHDAYKCFQLANRRQFTSWNHTCASWYPTLQDTTTHTHASSSRIHVNSRAGTIPVRHGIPHYKIPRRTQMLPARVHCQFTVTIPCVMHPHYKDTTTHRNVSSSRSRHIHSNHTLRACTHTTRYHTRTHMLPAREFTSIHELEPYLCVMVSCTTRYHDAHKCFQLANSRQFTSWNHTCASCTHTTSVPHTHTHASSSRSLSIHSNHTLASCTQHYKIPHMHTHASSVAFTSIHSNHTLRHCTHTDKIPRACTHMLSSLRVTSYSQ